MARKRKGSVSARQMIRDLIKSGWTQMQLSAECKVQQASISRTLNGIYLDLDYATGKRLERLWLADKTPPIRKLAKRRRCVV